MSFREKTETLGVQNGDVGSRLVMCNWRQLLQIPRVDSQLFQGNTTGCRIVVGR